MNLSAVRAEQADGKLADVREAFQIGIDAADDVATGRGTCEDQRAHQTTRFTTKAVLSSCAHALVGLYARRQLQPKLAPKELLPQNPVNCL